MYPYLTFYYLFKLKIYIKFYNLLGKEKKNDLRNLLALTSIINIGIIQVRMIMQLNSQNAFKKVWPLFTYFIIIVSIIRISFL